MGVLKSVEKHGEEPAKQARRLAYNAGFDMHILRLENKLVYVLHQWHRARV